jgi:hypothetical protein
MYANVPAISPAIVTPLIPDWLKLFARPKSVNFAVRFGE